MQLIFRASLKSMTPYRQLSWSLEAANLDVIIVSADTAEMPVKFQSDWKSSRLHGILREDPLLLSE